MLLHTFRQISEFGANGRNRSGTYIEARAGGPNTVALGAVDGCFVDVTGTNKARYYCQPMPLMFPNMPARRKRTWYQRML